MKKGLLTVVLVGLGAVGAAAAIGVVQRRIRTTIQVVALGLEVFWDVSCTEPVTSIDWGTLYPGGQSMATVYIRNSGSEGLTLSLMTEDWSPVEAETFITVTWDAEGVTLSPDSVKAAVITLNVNVGIYGVTDFSFDLVLSGAGP